MALAHTDTKRIIRKLGGQNVLRRRLSERGDRAYVEQHWDELLKQYGEQWVAVRDRTVVASNPNLEELVKALVKAGIKPREVVVEFVTANPNSMLL